MSVNLPPVSGPVSSEQRGSALGRVLGVFYRPSEVFHELDASPTWALALVVLIVISLGSQLMLMPRLDLDATIRQQISERTSGPQLSEEQIETQIEIAKKFARFQALLVPVGSAVVFLIFGGVYLLGLKATGSEADYKHTFSAVLHAYLPPSVVGVVVTTLVAIQRGSFTANELKNLVKSNVGAFLPPETPKALAAAASTFDLFNIWLWVLLVIGLEIIGHVKRSKAITVVAGLWIGWVVVKMAFSAIGSAF